eukprot:g20723.t1
MAKDKRKITVEGADITLLQISEDDFLSLTDIDKRFDGGGRHIENWLRANNTIEYLETWESLYNPDFNSMQLHEIKEQRGQNRFLLSAKKWITLTGAIGIRSKAGRYGGTYAHPDIAFNFCYWLSPSFQLYIAKEFQRLKAFEAKERLEIADWNMKRLLTKINHSVHTDAIKDNLMPPRLQKDSGLIFASEVDMINRALFGYTAREYKQKFPKAKGNMRDSASTEQLIVLANLEAINAELIRQGISQQERAIMLNIAAITQMKSLLNSPSWGALPPEKE